MNDTFHITHQPDTTQWKKFVDDHPMGNIFQLPCMLSLYKSVPGYLPGVIGLYDSDGEVVGILSYNNITERGWKKYFSSRSIITGGPLVKNNDPALAYMLLKAYDERIHHQHVIYCQVRNLHLQKNLDEVFNDHDFIYIDHLTIHLDLTKDIETLQKEMHPKRFSNIRRMSKKEIIIRQLNTRDLDDVYTIITKTYNRINMPRPPSALLLNACKYLQEHVVMFGAYNNKVLTGARIYLLYKGTMYDWYAASDLAYSHLHPNDILPWHAIRWGKNMGYTLYDFAGAGRAAIPYGVRDYKLKFGGKLIETGRWECIRKPLLYESSKTALQLFQHLKIKV